MERLVQHLEQQPDGTKIKVVGFTDDVGAFASNRNLSQDRASQVMATLRNYGGERIASIQFDSAGYGEVAPAFCNTDEGGRAINRRVEIWIGSQNG